MTKLVLNTKKLEISKISIKDAEHGKWYRISEYQWNKDLVGEVGVLTFTDDQDNPRAVVSPTGQQYSHPDIFLEEIQNVEIICS